MESIADRNNRIRPEAQAGWLRHPRWTLRKSLLRQVVEAWRALRVDFLGCLAQPGFAPPVLPDDETREAYVTMPGGLTPSPSHTLADHFVVRREDPRVCDGPQVGVA